MRTRRYGPRRERWKASLRGLELAAADVLWLGAVAILIGAAFLAVAINR